MVIYCEKIRNNNVIYHKYKGCAHGCAVSQGWLTSVVNKIVNIARRKKKSDFVTAIYNLNSWQRIW